MARSFGILGDEPHAADNVTSGRLPMETFVTPLTMDDLPESFHPTLNAVRSSEGEALVLDENMFIEKMLPAIWSPSASTAMQ